MMPTEMPVALTHLEILTSAMANEVGMAVPIESKIVGILYVDGAEPEALGFQSMARLLEFINEIAPDTLTVQGTVDEDYTELCLAIMGRSGAVLH